MAAWCVTKGTQPRPETPLPVLKQALRQHLRQTCPEQDLLQWYDPLELSLTEEERRVDVRFPHAFFGAWFAGMARYTFETQLRAFIGEGYALRYLETSTAGSMPIPASGKLPPRRLDPPFGAKFTFDTFIVNRKNEFPLAAAREAARSGTPRHYNPFVISGGSGNGKTHLLGAIANELGMILGPASVYFKPASDLHLLYAENDRLTVRKQLMERQALIIDDLHLLRDLPHIRQELVCLFDHFLEQQKQMAFACSGGLSELDFLEAPLRSRLELGLMVDLKEPDLDVRVRFIQVQCAAGNLQLTREHIILLAQRCHEFRHLSGILLKVSAYRNMVGRDIHDRELEQILRNTESGPERAVSFDLIVTVVSEHFGVTPGDVLGDKRQQKIVLARQIAMFLCRELMGSSFPALGRLFGGKDHSTTMYAVKKIVQIQHDKKDMHALVTELKRRCLNRDS